jgi:hypothetical protein
MSSIKISHSEIIEKCSLPASQLLQTNLYGGFIFTAGFIYLIYWQPQDFEQG